MKRVWFGPAVILAGVFLFAPFASATAAPPGTPPSPTAYYYGDADGDTLLTTFDLGVMNNLFNGQVYNYGTLQPDNPNDDWNTSDIDSDDLLTTFDLGYYSQHFNGQPLDLLDKPWIIEGVNLHASYTTTGVFFPFNGNVSAYNGNRGRAGVAVVAEILPVGSGSTTTGELTGRDCAAVDLFDLAGPGAQCSLAVTITDWQTNPILGLTENGTYGLDVMADAPGTIAIQLSVSDNGLGIEVPTLSTTVFTHFLATNAWVEVSAGSATEGGISSNSGSSSYPSLALDSSGNPVVAWFDDSSGNNEIYVRRFDGTNWVDVGTSSSSGGGISNNSGWSADPSLALDSSDNPVVAWWNSTTNYDIYVKRFNGTNWVDVGTGSSSGGGISNNSGWSYWPSLALDTSGNPVITWTDYISDNYEIYIKRFDGANWVDIGTGSSSGGGISNNGGASSFSYIALDSSGNPVVAWYDSSIGGQYEIYIKRFNGTNWVDVGTGSSSGGGISNNSGLSMYPSLALDSSGNPVIAWQDGWEIYLKRFDGANWVDVGTGSSSGGGISNNSGRSYRPSLALDSSGNPFVAWQDNSSGNYEIYVKRFDGVNWVDVGTGSSFEGGISGNNGSSVNPFVALDSTDNPFVAWDDSTGFDLEIYIKRYQP